MRVRILLFASTLCMATGSLLAQRPKDMPVTPAMKAEILEATADRVERYYVDAPKSKDIAAALRRSLGSGPVADATMALAFASAVNNVLKAGDAHLRFGYSFEPSGPDAKLVERAAEDAAYLAEAAQDGFGIHGVQRLEGNVGLLTWSEFHEPSVAGAAVSSAMQLLSSTEALIIDLRNSRGGSPQMVQFLVSYFIRGDPVLMTVVENRFLGTTQQQWTLPYVPGPHYHRDVFVLTSKRTWSAGEGLTEALRRLRGATVVGETTRGGARMSRWMQVHPNFAVSVSVARHIGETKDWEGVGIQPDRVVPEADALRVAHVLALTRLRDAATDPGVKAFYTQAIASIEKR